MKTKILEREQTSEIVTELKNGGLVAIMTDTVYGLGANSSKDELYAHLAKVKNRPEHKPFPLMAGSVQQIEEIAILTDRDRLLIRKFMPGPVTFIFKKKNDIFPFLKNQDTIGIRIANDPWLQGIIEEVGAPLWLPSANLSSYPTAVDSDMVLDQLDGLIEAVVKGEAEGGVSSSVFDLTGEQIKCLREGPVSLAEVEKEAFK